MSDKPGMKITDEQAKAFFKHGELRKVVLALRNDLVTSSQIMPPRTGKPIPEEVVIHLVTIANLREALMALVLTRILDEVLPEVRH